MTIRQISDSDVLKNIVFTLPGHIYWKNLDGFYLACNIELAKYYGFSSVKDIINKTDYDFFSKKVADQLRKNDLKIISDKKPEVIEERNKNDYFLSIKSPIKDQQGEIIGIMGCSINITKQKHLENQLKTQASALIEALKIKDNFLNNLSHEIRTPIHIISSLTSELSEQFYELSDKEKLEFIKLTENTTNKLSKFVKNILLLAKSKKGNLKLHPEKVEIIELVETVMKELSIISHSTITLKIPTHDKYYTYCTKYQIEQVIRNLLENAIKYGNNKPIDIIVSCQDNEIKVEIIDEGVGIPEEEKIKIFEAFEESSRTKNSSGGTGLGLAICKDIIKLHNGKIWVNSKESNGAHFIFTLPIIKKPQ